MANIVFSAGQPAFDWFDLLNQALNSGVLNNVGAGPKTVINLTSGSITLQIAGVGLTVDAARHFTGGTITKFVLKSGAQIISVEDGFATAPAIAALNALLANNNNSTRDAVFSNEGLNVTGSGADFEALRSSFFNDVIHSGAGDDFIAGSIGADFADGGGEYDTIGFHGLLGGAGTGLTVRMDTTGVAGGGRITGALPGGFANTRFVNMERVVGTEGNDTFIAGAGYVNTFDHDFNWVGGAGNDRFIGNGDQDIKINYDAEKFEHPGDNVWGNAPGEFGVIVNLSALTISANVGDGAKAVGSGKAIDTFRNVDAISGISGFKLTDAKDYFAGDNSGVRVEARGGDDTIIGGDGEDNLRGDDGNDTINAGDGNDNIEGGDGNDTINAGSGEFDYIDGSTGTDAVDGATGNDLIAFFSETTADTLQTVLTAGGPGRGTITGTFQGGAVATAFQNLEQVRGTQGADSFTVNAGFVNTEDANNGFNDARGDTRFFRFTGGRGTDVFTDNSGLAGGASEVDYREERWTIPDYDGHTWGSRAGEFGVIINLSAASIVANVGHGNETVAANRARDIFLTTDTINGVLSFQLTDANDYIVAGNSGVFARGEQGNDTFKGGAGNDQFNAGDGNDTAFGGVGRDHFNGDNGDDELRGGDGVDQLNGQNGNDTIFGDAGNDNMNGDDGNDTLNGGLGNDNASGQSGDDIINGDDGNDELRGEDGNDTVNGGNGNDRVEGGSGDDMVNGGAGGDILRGDDGNDTLNGGTGADRMEGWIGDDTYVVDALGDLVFEEGGNGIDLVQSAVTYSLVNSGEVEKLTLLGAAAISATGNGLSNTIFGNAGANSLNGLGGNDVLNGGAAGGLDVLTGGAGADTMTSGLGNDVFDYAAVTEGGDSITDYGNATGNNDTMRFLGAAFGNHATGALAAAEFQSSTANVAANANVRFFYETDTRTVWFDADGSGAADTAHAIATLQASATFTISDITII